jgi:3-hydroxy-9,10-secoandrosta-1,3,5(10)-triene-9,17-dione monooxygenase reductase component
VSVLPGSGVAAGHIAPEAARPAVTPARMREVLGHFASGVTVITGLDPGVTEAGPAGFACQSFHALSLEPPLVCLCVGKASTTWPRIRASGRFAVNILGAHQEGLSRTFATSGADKFAGVEWSPSPLGSPLLDDAVGWVDCTVRAVHDGGDHEIVIGDVVGLAARGGDPLLFFRGAYQRLG